MNGFDFEKNRRGEKGGSVSEIFGSVIRDMGTFSIACNTQTV